MTVTNLPKKKVELQDLILDPNNPRFSKNERELITNEAAFANDSIQAEALRKMNDKQFDVVSLEKSIKENGFVSLVQPILVRELKGNYLVIEGNRRTSALKNLIAKHKAANKRDDVLSDELLEQITSVEVVDCTNTSKDDVDVLLGMIHVGGTKDWELLPSSFYIYKLYSEVLCAEYGWEENEIEEKFIYVAPLAKKVAAKASITSKKVKDSLRVYRVFKQLVDEAKDRGHEESEVNYKKASLIQESLIGEVFERYFEFDGATFLMGDGGIDKWLNLMVGDEEQRSVIDNPPDLRSFKKVLSQGTEVHVDRVFVDREKPADVHADIQAELNERNLNARLRTVKKELGKIDIEGLSGFAESDKELLQQIEDRLKLLRGRI